MSLTFTAHTAATSLRPFPPATLLKTQAYLRHLLRHQPVAGRPIILVVREGEQPARGAVLLGIGQLVSAMASSRSLVMDEAKPTPPQLMRPACTMALRTTARVVSETGTMGRRASSLILPSSERAYLAGAGLVSTNSAV